MCGALLDGVDAPQPLAYLHIVMGSRTTIRVYLIYVEGCMCVCVLTLDNLTSLGLNFLIYLMGLE